MKMWSRQWAGWGVGVEGGGGAQESSTALAFMCLPGDKRCPPSHSGLAPCLLSYLVLFHGGFHGGGT